MGVVSKAVNAAGEGGKLSMSTTRTGAAMPFYIGIETVGNNFATLVSPGEEEPKNKVSTFTNSQADQAEASLRLLASRDGTMADSVVLCGPKRVLGIPIKGLHEPRLDMILNVG